MSTQAVAQHKPSGGEKLNQLASGYVIGSAINAAIRLNIAETIGDAEMSIQALAAKVGANEDALYRVLRFLSSVDVFKQVKERVFANNDTSTAMRKDVPGSQRAAIEFITDVFHMQMYADMLPTIKDGKTAIEHVTGKKCFDVFEDNPDEQRRFDDAMTGLSRNSVPGVLKSYDFSGIETLADIAGGHGLLLTSVLEQYPQMKGILFDLAHVCTGATKRIEELGLAQRCTTVVGDFFKSVPTADAYIMKHIIHDWDDEHCITILKNVHAAMAKSGARKLLLAEMMLPPSSDQPHPSFFLDVEMLMLPGGRERTEDEYKTLLQKAGFKLSRVVRTQGPTCIIEAVPS